MKPLRPMYFPYCTTELDVDLERASATDQDRKLLYFHKFMELCAA